MENDIDSEWTYEGCLMLELSAKMGLLEIEGESFNIHFVENRMECLHISHVEGEK